jgi:hypothetical protein
MAAPTTAPIHATAAGALVIASSPGSGKRIQLLSYALVAATGASVRLQSPSGTDQAGPFALIGNSGLVEKGDAEEPLTICGYDSHLVLNLAGNTPVGGRFTYMVEP